MKTKWTLFVTQGAMIAALYVVLTLISNMFGLAGTNVIQVRLSEALTILPCFTAAAVPGLFLGCILSNIMTGGVVLDIIFGSLATLIGAIITYKIGTHKFLAPIPPIVANTLIVPLILAYAYKMQQGIPFLMLTVGIGEVISCGILGVLLYSAVDKHFKKLF